MVRYKSGKNTLLPNTPFFADRHDLSEEASNHSPTQQEIQDHLTGLNRVSTGCAPGIDAERARAIGMGNYVKWFGDHGIEIYQVPCTLVFRLGPKPPDARPRIIPYVGGS